MRVFVTGATGFIGSAVVRELVSSGHQVLGLARGDSSAQALTLLGAEAHKGDLNDPSSLASGAVACDGVIHLAFNDAPRDVDNFADSLAGAMKSDLAAIAAMGDALAGTGKAFVGTSGTMVLTSGRRGTEEDAGDPKSAAGFRVPSENAVLALASRGVRACVVRPAPSVHGEGDHGFIPMLIKLARDKGVSAYVGEGENRWPAVHRLDAAKLFALALDRGEAGVRYHAVGEEGIMFRDIAGTIGRRLGVAVKAVSPEGAKEQFGPNAFIVPIDNPVSNALTRERLGWSPVHPGLLDDLKAPHYFELLARTD